MYEKSEERRFRRAPTRVAIGLGANLGDRLGNLCAAIEALKQLPHCRNFRLSAIYETEPIGCSEPLAFLNAAVTFETRLSPSALLQSLLELEQRLGRQRPYPNAPRSIDLDLLLYGNETMRETGLVIPHPRMRHRLFVLTPLREIWNASKLPGLGANAATLEAMRKSQNRLEDVIVKSQTQWPVELLG